MIYDFKDKEKLITIGDIHGELNVIQEMACRRPRDNEWNNAVVIVCGDVGLGFRDFDMHRLENVDKMFGEINSVLILVRGNHDDPSFYGKGKIKLNNVIAVEDYSIVNTANFSTILIGGATSVDRMWRLQEEAKRNKYKSPQSKHLAKFYWEDERVVFDYEKLKKALEANGKIDSVVTHTVVSFAPPFAKDAALSWFRIDKTLKDDLDAERKTMDQIYQCLTLDFNQTLRFWAYGHFHTSNRTNIGDCTFIGLNEQEFKDVNRMLNKEGIFDRKSLWEEARIRPINLNDIGMDMPNLERFRGEGMAMPDIEEVGDEAEMAVQGGPVADEELVGF